MNFKMCDYNHYIFSCRLCLNFYSKNVDLFESETYANVVAKINSCLDIKIIKNDCLPTVICPTCLEKIASWDSFQKRCQESQEQLGHWIENRQRDNESNKTNTSISPLNSITNTNIHVKEEVVEEDLEYTCSTFIPEFSSSTFSPINEIAQLKIEKQGDKLPLDFSEVLEMFNTLICKYCLKHLTTALSLINHLRLFHMTIPKYVCWGCKVTFRNKPSLRKHRASCPDKYRNIFFQEKKPPAKNKLIEISDTENKQIIYATRSQSLTNTDTTDVSLLIDVSSDTQQIEDLTINKAKMLGIAPTEYIFSCNICQKLFKTMNEWKEHSIIHNSEMDVSKNDSQTSNNLQNVEIDNSNQNTLKSDVSEEIKIKNVYSENVNFVTAQTKSVNEKKINRKAYKCHDCKLTFFKIALYASHRNMHAAQMRKKEPFVLVHCKDCKKMFSSLKSKKQHKCKLNEESKNEEQGNAQDNLNKTTENESTFLCLYCGHDCKYKSGMYKHQRRCEKRPKNFREFLKIHSDARKCNNCNVYCVNKSVLSRHLTLYCPALHSKKDNQKKLNTDPSDDNKKESNNSKTEGSPKLIIDYRKIINDQDMNIIPEANNINQKTSSSVCDLCNKKMLYQSGMKEHKKYCYFRRKSMCYQCNKKINTVVELREHNQKEHPTKYSDQNLFVCRKCRKQFPTKELHRLHMLKHKENDYKCQYCNKNFLYLTSRNQHEQVCKKRMIIQPVIGLINTVSSTIQLPHSPPPPNLSAYSPSSSSAASTAETAMAKIIKCGVCFYTFSTMIELRQHILIAHKPVNLQDRMKKTFFCQFCKMAFNRHSDLTRHFNEYHVANLRLNGENEGESAPPILSPAVPTNCNTNVCSICLLSFNSVLELQSHESAFHGGLI